jgi:hypothetical protein
MTDYIVGELVEGWCSTHVGTLRTWTQRLVELLQVAVHCSGVMLQPASHKRPDSELRTANSVRALLFMNTPAPS